MRALHARGLLSKAGIPRISFFQLNSAQSGVSRLPRRSFNSLPTMDSDSDSDMATRPSRPPSKILIVLDLNGTLMHRIGSQQLKLLHSREPPLPPPDNVLGGKKIYYRPHLDRFLEFLFARFQVGTWTSALEKNAIHMVTSLIPEHLRSQLKFNWTRERCTLVGPAKDHASIKDLHKLWSDPIAQSNGWTYRNTILIDDTDDKAARNPQNALHLRAFDVTDPSLDWEGDGTLLVVENYLSGLLERWESTKGVRDVRRLLAEHPLYTTPDRDQPNEAYLPREGQLTSDFTMNRRDAPGFSRPWEQPPREGPSKRGIKRERKAAKVAAAKEPARSGGEAEEGPKGKLVRFYSDDEVEFPRGGAEEEKDN